jgi:hypothetical protein
MTDVSCPTVARCVAVDSDANVLTSTTRAFASPPWTFSHLYPGEGNATYVSCPSISLCVAVDNYGNLYTTTTPSKLVARPRRGRDELEAHYSCRSVLPRRQSPVAPSPCASRLAMASSRARPTRQTALELGLALASATRIS